MPPLEPVTPPQVGDHFAGRYRLEAILGVGGFGQVFRASRLDTGQEVAIKVLGDHLLESAEELERFAREARLVQKLDHPNTVRLYDFGQTERGLPYIVFQLLRGVPLEQVIEQEAPLPPERVRHVAVQVLRALSEAHGLGIVHRDIKPANLFLSDFQGETDFVTILDFGVAKMILDGQGVETTLTAAGVVLGTPSYMAPEQVTGAPIGPWTDLYALGLIMAEMLTGQVVVAAASPVETCLAQASSEPVPLPEAVLSSPLGEVILGATHKDQAKRFRSAGGILDALEGRLRAREALNTTMMAPAIAAPPPSGRDALARAETVSAEELARAETVSAEELARAETVSAEGLALAETLVVSAPDATRKLARSSLLWIGLGVAATMLFLALAGTVGVLISRPTERPALRDEDHQGPSDPPRPTLSLTSGVPPQPAEAEVWLFAMPHRERYDRLRLLTAERAVSNLRAVGYSTSAELVGSTQSDSFVHTIEVTSGDCRAHLSFIGNNRTVLPSTYTITTRSSTTVTAGFRQLIVSVDECGAAFTPQVVAAVALL